MDWGIFKEFVAWLNDYDNEIETRKCVWHGNPAIQFILASWDEAIYISAIEHGFDVDKYGFDEFGFNVYVVAQ